MLTTQCDELNVILSKVYAMWLFLIVMLLLSSYNWKGKRVKEYRQIKIFLDNASEIYLNNDFC